jgi:hypothetical protein
MANPLTSFRELYAATPNPYAAPGDLYNTFQAVVGNVPATILATTESTAYPLALLCASEELKPLIILAPFSMRAVLPGAAVPQHKYGFCGDFSTGGAMPPLTQVSAAHFHLTNETSVLPEAAMAAAWMGVPAGELVLGVPDPAENPVLVRTRSAMPIPHDFLHDIIDAYNAGTLTWQWLWEQVAVQILADVNQTAAYQPFIDYLRVSSTRRPPAAPAAAGALPREPATMLNIVGALVGPTVQEMGLTVARGFLPGLREPAGVGAQLNQINQQQVGIQTALAASQNRTKSMERNFPTLFRLVQWVCEAQNEADFAPYWVEHPNLEKGAWLSQEESTTFAIANAEGMLAPIISPTLATDIGLGRFIGQEDDIMEGLSIFRVRPGNSPNRGLLATRNRVYTVTALGTGQAGAPAVTMVLNNASMELPEESEHFRGVLKGYYTLCLGILGAHNRGVREALTDHCQHRTKVCHLGRAPICICGRNDVHLQVDE